MRVWIYTCTSHMVDLLQGKPGVAEFDKYSAWRPNCAVEGCDKLAEWAGFINVGD